MQIKRFIHLLTFLACLPFLTSVKLEKAIDVTLCQAQEKRLDALKRISQTITDPQNYAYQTYGVFGLEALMILKAIGEQYTVLLSDPGLVYHIQKFQTFMKAHSSIFNDPWKAREAFSQFLGTKLLFRGMKLTDKERQGIAQTGIVFPTARTQCVHTGVFSPNYIEQIRLRVFNAMDKSMFLSMTEYSDVAYQATLLYGEQKQGQSYILTLEIPEIDLIYIDKTSFMSSLVDLFVTTSGHPEDELKKMEIFIFGKIEAQEIVSEQIADT